MEKNSKLIRVGRMRHLFDVQEYLIRMLMYLRDFLVWVIYLNKTTVTWHFAYPV